MSTERINQLHERASECYLNGDYQGAVEAWREVLTIDPHNEQAQGGVRLAAQFVEREAPAAVAASPDVESELDRGLMVLDGIGASTLLHADPTDGATDRKPDLEPEGEPELADPLEGWGAETAPAIEEGNFGLDPLPEPPPDQPAPVSRAVSELKRRVLDLLAEAKAKADAGDRDDALSILARLSILDDDNAEAEALRAKIEAIGAADLDKIEQAIIEGVAAMEAGRLDEADRQFRVVLAMAPDHREARHFLETVSGRRLGGDEDLLRAADAEAAPQEGAVSRAINNASAARASATATKPAAAKPRKTVRPPPEDSDPVPVARRSRFAMPSPTFLIVAGVGAVVLVGGAIAVPRFFLGSATTAATVNAPAHRAARPAKPKPVPKEAGKPATTPASPEGAAQAIASQLAKASTLQASGDFGGAVLAFNEVLRLDPGNAVAAKGLVAAGEGYKAGQAAREAVDGVRLAFRDGEFTSALRLAYRFPPSIDKSFGEQVKIAGWYNLAVVALRAGDIREAHSHLDEALQIGPTDAEAKALKEFASQYAGVVRDRAFLSRVEALSFRSLP